MTTTPVPLTEPCELDTCPVGSPATGFNASNRKQLLYAIMVVFFNYSEPCLAHLNYVNAFPYVVFTFLQFMFDNSFTASIPLGLASKLWHLKSSARLLTLSLVDQT